MLTPILIILLLVIPYASKNLIPLNKWQSDPHLPAAAGLGLVFFFTASGHFLQTDLMVQMLPPWVPVRRELVYATGIFELIIAIALFFRRYQNWAAWSAGAALVAFFPANVYGAFEYVPLGGHAWGPVYLLIRAPLQLFVLWWIWAKVLRAPKRFP